MSDTALAKTILLVEDEALIAMKETEILKKHGYKVLTAYSGEKAIEAVKNNTIDLVLMDIDLGSGKMDGTEAAEKILRERELPIVFLTGHTERKMVERVKGITRYGYVIKNSGEFVLIESIQMAFELFNTHKALQTSENKYKTIFENSPLGIFRSTPEGRFLEVNSALAEMLGYATPKEVLENIYSIAEQIYVDSKKRDPIVQKQLSVQGIERYFNRYKKKDGSIFVANLYLKTIRDEKGDPLFFEGIVEDVTDKMQLETALQESEEKYRLLAENSSDAILYLDKNFQIQYVSPSLAANSGYENADARGFDIFSTIHPDFRQEVRRRIRENIEQRKTKSSSLYKALFMDGTTPWIEAKTKYLYDENNTFSGLIVNHRDVTERIYNERLAEENRSNIQFLTETAFHFLDRQVETDIYSYIGICLHQLNPDAYIIVNSVDWGGKKIKTETVSGFEKQIEKIISILGVHPVGREYAFDDSLYELADGLLKKFGKGLYELSFGAIPRLVSNSLEKILKIRNIYGIAFIVDEEIYADAILLLPKNKHIVRGETIEAFTRQAAIALKRVKTEEELRKSRRQMELFINSSPDFYFLKDNDLRYRICNSANARFFQKEIKDIIGKTDFDLMPAGAAEECKATDEAAMKTKEIVSSIERVDQHVYETIKIPIVEDNSVVGVAGIIRDITEQKQIEESLRESEEKVKNILDSLSDGIAVMEPDYTVVLTNSKLRNDIGKQSEQDIIGKKCYSAFYGFDTQCDWCPAKSVLQNRTSSSSVVPFPAEEPRHWFHLEASPIFNTEGEILYIVESARDITLLKKNEQEREFLMKELNHRVKNNLLMINSLIHLKDATLGDKVDLSDLAHQIDAIRIVHEKLYHSEDIAHIDIKEYFSDILSAVFTLSGRNVTIKSNIEESTLHARTAVPLGLIINEIATNAIKHGFSSDDDGRAKFTIDLRHTPDCELTLSNSGGPFPADVDFKKPETLGLRLISALVDQLGGTIDLKRGPHPEFTIRFPAE